MWSWRESNPRPNISATVFLHAYSGIACREGTGTGRTDVFRSWMVLGKGHSLPLQQPVFFFSRRRNLVTGLPVRRP